MRRSTLKIAYFYFLAALCSCIVVYLLILSVKPNPITLRYNLPFKNTLNALAPQGWAFFTKDVKKDYFNLYTQDREEFQLKASGVEQFFGFKRDNRIINHKIGSVLNNLNAKYWYAFKGDPHNVPQDSLTKLSIKISPPMVYGVFLVEKGKPLPYEWHISTLKVRQTMDYVLLEIKK